jgi:N-acetylglutamate synthase-like GNAT family acetyltransferase
MEIAIKPLTNAESRPLTELVLNIQQIEFKIPITREDQPDLMDIENYYRGSGGDVWGAFAGDRLVGSIAIISIGRQAGAVRKVFVQKEYRGKEWGIANRLLETLIAYCGRAQITDLYLGTLDRLLAAGRFYEKHGFVRIDKAKLPPEFPLMEVDNTFYHLPLSKYQP